MALQTRLSLQRDPISHHTPSLMKNLQFELVVYLLDELE